MDLFVNLLMELLSPLETFGMGVFTLLAFMVDSIGIPMFPDIVFSLTFMFEPTIEWGIITIIIASVGEGLGMYLLYIIVEKIGVPKRIESVMNKYINFLICNDERMLLVNRVAPMIMFAGAFVSVIDHWKISKALFWNMLGCFLKYTALMILSYFFFQSYSREDAQSFTIILAVSVMIVCFGISYLKQYLK